MQTQTIATAISSLSGLLSEPAASFEGLATLHDVREKINDLFDSYAAELRADPNTAPMWNAIAAALPRPAHATSAAPSHDARVEAFWREHSEQFTWDFVPMEVVHEIYTDWMRRQHPSADQLTRLAFSRSLRRILPGRGAWRYTRARAGALARVDEPLARGVDWRPDGNAAVYGLRRQAA
jgi:hypothetical protein